MAATISIEIPREVAQAARMTPEELRRELAVHLFERGVLSFGKARELANMTVWTFSQLLASREIPVHYGAAEYEEDRATLQRLGRL